MAHDFRISYKDDKAYFFGYCNGVMYHVFHAEAHDAIFSGDNGRERVTVKEAKRALSAAINYFDKSGYPDPKRMDDIKAFRSRLNKYPNDDLCEIWYG